MIYSFSFENSALKVIAKWKKSNPALYKKFCKVLEDTVQHPRTGIGHPEPLVGGGDITYSRRITAHDRMIYNIHDELIEILIIQVEEHYNDK